MFIHLLRHANQGERTFRLGHRISLPSILSLRPGSEPYLLTGILLHDGQSLHSGHFTAVTRCILTGRLYCTDDANEIMLLDDERLQEVEEKAYVLVYSLEAATREAAAQVQGQGVLFASQEPMEVGSELGEQDTVSTPQKMDMDEGCSNQKRGESFTPRQSVKLKMTASSPEGGGCPGCAAEVQGHQCQEAGPSSGTAGQGDGSWNGSQQQTSPSRPSDSVQEWEWAAGLELEPPSTRDGRGRGRAKRGGGAARQDYPLQEEQMELGEESGRSGRQDRGRGRGNIKGSRQNSHASLRAKSAKKREFTDDFYPDVKELEKMTAAVEERKVYLQERLYRLQQDDFSWAGLPPNPLHRGIIKMEEKLQQLDYAHCRHCDELLLGERLSPRDERCGKCNEEWRHAREGQVLMWSAANDMHCTEVPPVLQDLSPVEQSAIARNFVVMKIYRVARGAIHLKGHCLSVLQDLPGFMKRLPPAPRDLPMIFLVGPGQKVCEAFFVRDIT